MGLKSSTNSNFELSWLSKSTWEIKILINGWILELESEDSSEKISSFSKSISKDKELVGESKIISVGEVVGFWVLKIIELSLIVWFSLSLVEKIFFIPANKEELSGLIVKEGPGFWFWIFLFSSKSFKFSSTSLFKGLLKALLICDKSIVLELSESKFRNIKAEIKETKIRPAKTKMLMLEKPLRVFQNIIYFIK